MTTDDILTSHHFHDLVIGFTMTKHDGSFRHQRRFVQLGVFQHTQRLPIACPPVTYKPASNISTAVNATTH